MGAQRPVTRNLTSLFIQHRREHKNRVEDTAGYDPLPGAEGGDLEGGRRSEFHRAELPPSWVDASVEAQEDISAVSDKLAQLVKAQQKRLMNVMADSSADKDVEALSAELNALIRRCEQSIHQVKTKGRDAQTSALEMEFRTNMQRSLASQLSQLSKQCREKQKDYISELKRRHGPNYDDGLGPTLGSGDGTPTKAGSEGMPLLQTQDLDLERRENFAAQRSNDICKLADSVSELNTMFKELAVLVIDQGTVLDRIDYNTEQMVVQGQRANAQLKQAEKTKQSNDSRSFKCMGILLLANVILLLLLMLKYKLKYGISFVGMFWFMLWMGGAAVAGFYVVRYRPQWVHKACPTIASYALPNDTNPNGSQQTKFQRWASNAKSAVGMGSTSSIPGLGSAKQMQIAAKGVAAANQVASMVR